MEKEFAYDSNNRFTVVIHNLSNDKNIPDRKSFLDHLNKSQSFFEFTSEPTIIPDFTISLIKNENNEIYQSEVESALINTMYFERNRDKLTLESKYFYGYIISICVLEYLFKENTDSTMKILRDNNPQVINEYIWYTQIPTHAKDILDANFISEKLRELRSALHKIIMLSQPERNKLSEKTRLIANILREFRVDVDLYSNLSQILIHCNQEKLDNIYKSYLADENRTLKDFLDIISEIETQDTLSIFEALVNPIVALEKYLTEEEIEYLYDKKEEIYFKVHGEHSPLYDNNSVKSKEDFEKKGEKEEVGITADASVRSEETLYPYFLIKNYFRKIDFEINDNDLREIIEQYKVPENPDEINELENIVSFIKEYKTHTIDKIINFFENSNHPRSNHIAVLLESSTYDENANELITEYRLAEDDEKERIKYNLTRFYIYNIIPNRDSKIIQQVAEYINTNTKSIFINYKPLSLTLAWEADSSFSINSIKTIPDEIKEEKNFSIILVSSPTQYIWEYRNEFAIISSSLLDRGIDVEELHLYVYFTIIVILEHELAKYLHLQPNYWPQGSSKDIENYIKNGILKDSSIKTLEKLSINDDKYKLLFNDIKNVLGLIKSSYYKKEDIQEVSKPKVIGSTLPSATIESGNPPDALEYRVFANAFGDLITHPQAETPLTIGICAPWGQGKTVLQNYIIERIDSNNNNGDLYCHCIEFNAWKYTKSEQIWAEFYSTLIESVFKSLNVFSRFKFRSSLFVNEHPIITRIISIITGMLLGLIIIYFIIPAETKFFYSIISKFLESFWGKVIKYATSSGAIITILYSIYNFVKSVTKSIFKRSNSTRYKEALGLQHEIFDGFEKVNKTIQKIKNYRIAVFIDDIDRCQPSQILQVLEAIKLFIDSKNFIFILGMDAKVVRLAVGEQYEFMAEEFIDKEKLGRHYLEKIIQIPFHLPHLSSKHMIKIKDDLFEALLKDEQPPPKKPLTGVEQPPPEKPITGVEQPPPEKPVTGVEQPPPEKPITDVEQPVKGKNDLPPKTTIDTKLVLRISSEESLALNDIFNDDLVLSPRLVLRLRNIYIIAKHLYIMEHNEDPSTSLIKMLALSIKYPFISKDLLKFLKTSMVNDWESISKEFNEKKNNNGEYIFNFNQFIKHLKSQKIDPSDVVKYEQYVSYFNLVLE